MLRYHLKTFGCQMNVHDSERMHEVLQAAGFEPTDELSAADVVVLNTCSVREKAEQKLRSLVGTLDEFKSARPDMVLAVAGCMAEEHAGDLLRAMKTVDLVVGPDHLVELPRLVHTVRAERRPVVRSGFDVEAPAFLQAAPMRKTGPQASAFVAVMKGCDERCSFCIVPYTRGPERYRSSEEILEEIRRLVDGGTREIVLLGQTVNSYRDPSRRLGRAPEADPADPDESEFAALLYEIAARVPRLERLRYTSPHPRHVTPSLVGAHRSLDVLAQHVHLPVQSGSSRMLRRMIRRYTREEYIERAERLLETRPGFTLSTDVIVGFPGETESEFEETLSLVERIGYKGLFGFKYSPRPHTPSLRLQDDVPEQVKARRLAMVFERSEALLQRHLSSLVGTVQRVLVEGLGKAGAHQVTGRTARNEIVHLEVGEAAGAGSVGTIVEARIVRAFKHSLQGEPTARAHSSAGQGTADGNEARRRRLPIVRTEPGPDAPLGRSALGDGE